MSKKDLILDHLVSGKPITAFEALSKYGSLRLASRIYDLRADGYNIESKPKRVESGAIVSEYRIVT